MSAFWEAYARIGNLTLGALLWFGLIGGVLHGLNRARLISDLAFVVFAAFLALFVLTAWFRGVFGL